MNSRGNIYQNLIFAAQAHLDRTGALPADLAEFSRLTRTPEDEIRDLFGSVDELLEGLIYHAVTLLNDALREGAISCSSSDPFVQLHAIADSYLGWAEANPALFRLLVTGLNGPIQPGSTLHRYTSSMRDLYHRKLIEARRLGLLAEDTDIEVAMMMLHCIVKGGNMMFLTRATDPWFADDSRSTVELAKSIFSQFMDNMLRANAPRDSKVRASA